MIKEDFLAERSQWRSKWNEFFEANPGAMDVEDFPKYWRCIVTCRTPGCPMENHSHIASVSEQLDGVYKVLCGRCNRPVEDIDPMLEDDEGFRLETSYPDGSSWVIFEEEDDD